MTDYHKTPSSTILNIPLPPEEEALRVLRDCLDNEEIVHVVERYVLDEEPTDLQRMMLDGAARERVVGELGKIAEVANWSLAESLRDAADGTITNLNMIAGTQLKVDSVAGALRDAGSRLYAEDTYPTPDDSAYWDREAGFIAGRKESGDSRWNTVSDVEDIESIRAEAQSYEPLLEAILQDAIGRAEAKDSVVGMSHRVKGVESLVNKVKKFRQTEWGANATVADAVDLIGGRVVVDNLQALEGVMVAIEELAEEGRLEVLRKENKFIANYGESDPYRAIHYVISMPGGQQTAELQLKTLSSMVASDLYHNAVYKPHILGLPGELQDSIAAYNWQSVEQELIEYAMSEGIQLSEHSPEGVELEGLQRAAIGTHDYNGFYDTVLSRIDPMEPLSDETKELIAAFHADETSKLYELYDQQPDLVLALAAVAHNAYYDKAVADMVANPKKPQLGNEITPEGLQLLPADAQKRYASRYEVFNGSNNKLSALDLGLNQLSEDELQEFFVVAGKDVDDGQVAELIGQIKRHREGDDQSSVLAKTALLNLFHAPFEELNGGAKDTLGASLTEGEAYERWQETLLSSQIKAIATSSLLTEIGLKDTGGEYRDISRPVFVGEGYTMREFLTFAVFVAADRKNSEFANTSYEDFVHDPSSAWARDFDKMIDTSILHEVINVQGQTIRQMIDDAKSNVELARLQKARFELATKLLYARGERERARRLARSAKDAIIRILATDETYNATRLQTDFEALAVAA